MEKGYTYKKDQMKGKGIFKKNLRNKRLNEELMPMVTIAMVGGAKMSYQSSLPSPPPNARLTL